MHLLSNLGLHSNSLEDHTHLFEKLITSASLLVKNFFLLFERAGRTVGRVLRGTHGHIAVVV